MWLKVKVLGPKKFLGLKEIKVPKILGPKYFGSEKFGFGKNFVTEKNVGSKYLLV